MELTHLGLESFKFKCKKNLERVADCYLNVPWTWCVRLLAKIHMSVFVVNCFHSNNTIAPILTFYYCTVFKKCSWPNTYWNTIWFFNIFLLYTVQSTKNVPDLLHIIQHHCTYFNVLLLYSFQKMFLTKHTLHYF